MPFSKSFPQTTGKSVYPKWVEIALTEQEEKELAKDIVDESGRRVVGAEITEEMAD